MPFKIIGYIGRPYGLEGKFFLSKPVFDAQALRSLKYVYVGKEDEPEDVLALCSVEEKGKRICLSLASITSREDLERFIHSALFVREEQANKLSETEQATSLIAYRVVQDGEVLGEVTDWLSKPVQDILTFKTMSGSEVMVPFVGEFIISVDKNKRQVHVRLLEGMLNDN